MAAEDFIITRKRKKYKFARFAELPNCYEAQEYREIASQFSADSYVSLELGAGTGLFSLELARLHPDRQFVAADVKADRLYTGALQANEAGIGNIAFVRINAAQLPEIFPPQSVADLWLTFADPFPKDRHAKHRMTHPAFLEIYRQLLAPGDSRFCFKTDNEPLFKWSLEQLVAFGFNFKFLSFDVHAADARAVDFDIMTTYEKRYVREGKPICALVGAFDSCLKERP